MKTLSFEQIATVSAQRSKKWHKDGEAEWTILEWAGAMCGECGEAANVAKKIRRIQLGMNLPRAGKSLGPEALLGLIEHLGEELADTFLYMVLLASKNNIDLPQAILKKFNSVSEEYGFPEQLIQENRTHWTNVIPQADESDVDEAQRDAMYED